MVQGAPVGEGGMTKKRQKNGEKRSTREEVCLLSHQCLIHEGWALIPQCLCVVLPHPQLIAVLNDAFTKINCSELGKYSDKIRIIEATENTFSHKKMRSMETSPKNQKVNNILLNSNR